MMSTQRKAADHHPERGLLFIISGGLGLQATSPSARAVLPNLRMSRRYAAGTRRERDGAKTIICHPRHFEGRSIAASPEWAGVR